MEETIYTDKFNNKWRCKSSKRGICISLLEAGSRQVITPMTIDGVRVVEIDKKAFLSQKSVSSMILSPYIDVIGDWAFSHAENLENIFLPKRAISFGKKMFLGAKKLKLISYYDMESQEGETFWHNIASQIPFDLAEDDKIIGWMTAYGCSFLNDETIVNLYNEKMSQWLHRWDDLLLRFIQRDDLEGYVELFSCGEEDYEGREYDIESYPRERRFEKLRGIYYRLMHPLHLLPETKEMLDRYLREHAKGCNKPEAWDLLMEEYADDLDAYRSFAQAGGLTEDNFADSFADAQKKNTQIKAFLLKWKEENLEPKAKDEFDLGW